MLLAALYERNKVKYIMFFKCKRELKKTLSKMWMYLDSLMAAPTTLQSFNEAVNFFEATP